MNTRTLATFLLAGTLAAAASGGVIGVSNIGGGIVLNSGPLGPNVFGDEQTAWTATSLGNVHSFINASGINTNGVISIFAADTGHGLALLTLIDQQLVLGSPVAGHVHMDTVGNGTNLAYIKDTQGNVTVTPNGPNARIASGNFLWNSNGGGDAFAWADLNVGNVLAYRFNRNAGESLGLNENPTFQFLNWTGTAWEIIAIPNSLLSFSQSGDFGFSATVVPAPSVAAILGLPIGATLIRRRRVA